MESGPLAGADADGCFRERRGGAGGERDQVGPSDNVIGSTTVYVMILAVALLCAPGGLITLGRRRPAA
jgi:hypothetical protein